MEHLHGALSLESGFGIPRSVYPKDESEAGMSTKRELEAEVRRLQVECNRLRLRVAEYEKVFDF